MGGPGAMNGSCWAYSAPFQTLSVLTICEVGPILLEYRTLSGLNLLLDGDYFNTCHEEYVFRSHRRFSGMTMTIP